MSDDRRTCPVAGCTACVKPGILMCLTHWKQVPDKTRRMVNAAWRHYRDSSQRYQPTQFGRARKAYESARDAAIAEAGRFEP